LLRKEGRKEGRKKDRQERREEVEGKGREGGKVVKESRKEGRL
jgi:hypothetical protein